MLHAPTSQAALHDLGAGLFVVSATQALLSSLTANAKPLVLHNEKENTMRTILARIRRLLGIRPKT
jgi:hypothetical protein